MMLNRDFLGRSTPTIRRDWLGRNVIPVEPTISTTAVALDFENVVVNGSLNIDQRQQLTTSTFIEPTRGYFYFCDRFRVQSILAAVGFFYGEYKDISPNDVGSFYNNPLDYGLNKCCELIRTTGDYVPGISEYNEGLQFNVEAADMTSMLWSDVASAKTTVLSFWFRATNHVGNLHWITVQFGEGSNIQYCTLDFSTFSTKWEKKTLYIPAPTVALTSNNIRFYIDAWGGGQTGHTSNFGVWGSTISTYKSLYPVGVGYQDPWRGVGSFISIAGVKWSINNTDFVVENRQLELMRCMRHYEKSFDYLVKPQPGPSHMRLFDESNSIQKEVVFYSGTVPSDQHNIKFGQVRFRVEKALIPSVVFGNDSGLILYGDSNSPQRVIYEIETTTAPGFNDRIPVAPINIFTNGSNGLKAVAPSTTGFRVFQQQIGQAIWGVCFHFTCDVEPPAI